MISRSRLRRRTTLAAAMLAPAVLASCDLDPPRGEGRVGGPAPAVATPGADSALVAAVLGELVSAEAVLAAAVGAAPGLERLLAPLAGAHAAHRVLLAGATPEATSAPSAPVTLESGRASVLNAVRSSEARLQRAALASCIDASSGDLARVLASLAASTSQHLAVLGNTVVGDGSRSVS